MDVVTFVMLSGMGYLPKSAVVLSMCLLNECHRIGTTYSFLEMKKKMASSSRVLACLCVRDEKMSLHGGAASLAMPSTDVAHFRCSAMHRKL